MRLAIAAAAMLTAVGTAIALQRGGGDFDVFYHAWNNVLVGSHMSLYAQGPDRFLYAPGFAWLLSPFALLPRDLSLALWCLLKTGVLAAMLRVLGTLPGVGGLGWAALGLLFGSRALLIDYQYGQVNTFILASCAWALASFFAPARKSIWREGLPWFFLAIASAAKLFPLPLLALPLFSGDGGRRIARLGGVALGIALVLLIPLVSMGWGDALTLMASWKEAIVARGFPIESHNQSFAAMLLHGLTGIKTPVIALGPQQGVSIGITAITEAQHALIAAGWSFCLAGILLGLLMNPPVRASGRWIGLVIAALILPLHLVWKPYFIFGAPLAAWVVHDAVRAKSSPRLVACFLIWVIVNLSSVDVVGPEWTARLEAASILLLGHLGLIGLALASRE